MTTAEIIAIALLFIAVSDIAIWFAWLGPKLKKNAAQIAMLPLEEKEVAMKQQQALGIVKLVMLLWGVIALAIAFYLWNNPNTF